MASLSFALYAANRAGSSERGGDIMMPAGVAVLGQHTNANEPRAECADERGIWPRGIDHLVISLRHDTV